MPAAWAWSMRLSPRGGVLVWRLSDIVPVLAERFYALDCAGAEVAESERAAGGIDAEEEAERVRRYLWDSVAYMRRVTAANLPRLASGATPVWAVLAAAPPGPTALPLPDLPANDE